MPFNACKKELVTDYVWVSEKSGEWYVLECNGVRRTGPFNSKRKAIDWFFKELDKELVPN